jgi:hypothetical protein
MSHATLYAPNWGTMPCATVNTASTSSQGAPLAAASERMTRAELDVGQTHGLPVVGNDADARSVLIH